MIFSKLNLIVGGLAGLVISAGVILGWMVLIHDPEIRTQTRQIVEVEAEQHFNKATGELSNESDKARLIRRHCTTSKAVNAPKAKISASARSIAGTSLVGARGQTHSDQDKIDDTVAGLCAVRVWRPSECAKHGDKKT